MNNITIDEAKAMMREQPNETDINLISEVRCVLFANTLGQLAINSYDTHRYITEAMNKKPEIQRYFLNKYWGLQLMNSDDVSTDVRSYLIPDGTIEEWIYYFKEKIVPFLIKNQLPKNF
jgi:hypothetical protein